MLDLSNATLAFSSSFSNSATVTDSVGNVFATDTWETYNTPAVSYTAPILNEVQRLKWAGGATPYRFVCHYSRPPTITPPYEGLFSGAGERLKTMPFCMTA